MTEARAYITAVSKRNKDKSYTFTVECPYCGKEHQHGAPSTKELRNPGHRIAHCGKGSYEIVSMNESLMRLSRIAVQREHVKDCRKGRR